MGKHQKGDAEKIALLAITLFVAMCVSLAGWQAERWFNWKFGYGPKVDSRIEALEQRLETLTSMQARIEALEARRPAVISGADLYDGEPVPWGEVLNGELINAGDVRFTRKVLAFD